MHGVQAARSSGYEAVVVNNNPETVSTDFDTADKLYFDPVFWEHIYDIIKHEKPEGVIVLLGGQTALKLAEKLNKYNIPILQNKIHHLIQENIDFSSLPWIESNSFFKKII